MFKHNPLLNLASKWKGELETGLYAATGVGWYELDFSSERFIATVIEAFGNILHSEKEMEVVFKSLFYQRCGSKGEADDITFFFFLVLAGIKTLNLSAGNHTIKKKQDRGCYYSIKIVYGNCFGQYFC